MKTKYFVIFDTKLNRTIYFTQENLEAVECIGGIMRVKLKNKDGDTAFINKVHSIVSTEIDIRNLPDVHSIDGLWQKLF